ncbi:MAG: hypothetical protein HDT41_03780, partial [Lachnospiraceae bacterium]|nr:hypothetical protein [Lachnospiraceae bacterium]
PKSYDVRIEDETGNIYINDADLKFELVLLVGDGSYEESLKDKEHLMENAKKEDVTVTKTVTEYDVEGKSYAYFTFEYNDKSSINTVVYTAASEDKKIGINFVRNADISEEEVITQIDTFLHQLEAVDLKDSVQQDIDDADQVPDGQLLDETTLKLGESKITTKVAEGYYLVHEYKSDDSYSQLFETKDQKISVNTQFFKENYYESADDYVKEQINVIDAGDSSYSDINISDLQSFEINGYHIVYSNISYTYDSDGNKAHYTKIVAATVTSGNSLYVLEASTLYDEELNFDSIKDFMTISN